jgi:Family of unknown function (DUF6454)
VRTASIVVAGVAGLAAATLAPGASQEGARATVGERIRSLARDSSWTLVSKVPMKFATHHPQGMVRIGDALFVSSVEIRVPTQRFPQPVGGHDRDTGEGAGHLFKIDMREGKQGGLLADLAIGDGSIYHPGGIDFDGVHIWVPVAEYRPNSRSIVYRVDPEAMTATAVLRVADHIGAIVANTDDRTLHGVSWGSRRFYRWSLGLDGRVGDADAPLEKRRTLNPSHYVDYQDCKYAGRRTMVCGGVAELRQSPDAAPFRLGGIDLIDLADGRPLHQAPVLLWTTGGLDMTHNPVWIEPAAQGLRAYFMPEDDRSNLYIYELNAQAAPR